MIDAQYIALITALAGAAIGFCKWAVGLWAAVRREGIEESRRAADVKSLDDGRMIAALVGQATSNAVLTGRIDALTAQLNALTTRLDAGFESISKVDNPVQQTATEWSPPQHHRDRTKTPLHSAIREPRRGSHHDEE